MECQALVRLLYFVFLIDLKHKAPLWHSCREVFLGIPLFYKLDFPEVFYLSFAFVANFYRTMLCVLWNGASLRAYHQYLHFPALP